MCRRQVNHVAVTAFMFVTMLWTYSSIVSAEALNVKALVLFNSDDPSALYDVRPISAGLRASLSARHFRPADGIQLDLLDKQINSSNIIQVIDDAMNDNPEILFVLGPYGDDQLLIIEETLARHDLVAVDPLTFSTEVRRWSPHFYFLSTNPVSELFTLIRYAVRHLRLRRIGFMYLTNVLQGSGAYKMARRFFNDLGYAICGVFELSGLREWTGKESEFLSEWESFVEKRPQAVIVFGKPSSATRAFIERMLTDNRTGEAYILSPFGVQSTVLSVWKAAVASGVPFRSGQIVTSGTNPLASDIRYAAIRRFQTDAKAYLSASSGEFTGDSEIFLNDHAAGERMVRGWIIGEVLAQMLAVPDFVMNRSVFSQSLFDQRRYLVDDLVIGDYGGPCTNVMVEQGAACDCNQGGRTVLVKRFVDGFVPQTVRGAEFNYPLSVCYPRSVKLYGPMSAVTFHLVDADIDQSFLDEVQGGLYAALSPSNNRKHVVTLKVLTSKYLDAMNALKEEVNSYLTDVVFGMFATRAVHNGLDVVFFDTFSVNPSLTLPYQNVIQLATTLEQELYVLAIYFQTLGNTSVSALIRGRNAAPIADVLASTLTTFGIPLQETVLRSNRSAPLPANIPTNGVWIIIGLQSEDVNALVQHMMINRKLLVALTFNDVSIKYAALVSAFASKDLSDRLLFATNIPHWAHQNTSSTVVKMFHKVTKNASRWTPLTLRSYLSMSTLEYFLETLDTVSPKTILEAIYSTGFVSLGSRVSFGPFSNETDDGMINYGARDIAVWSFSRALDPSVALLANPVTPQLVYTSPEDQGLTHSQLSGVIGGSVAFAVLVAVIVVLLVLFCRDKRNVHAPKDVEHPVTLIFTDIQSSTALWAACPDVMADAVVTHHRLIRRLIAKHKCYEVKTIDNSFMIACKSASAAVQLVGDLQRTFLQHDWGTSAMDAAYHEFEERQAEEDADYEPPTARLDAAVYRKYWSGLRVRAGVHTGLSDIRHDEVTRGYDYYGSTSNTAARTESVAHGGQVLLTGAAYMALSAAERAGLDVTALGPVELRGVPQPVEMYQLNAVPGRAFAKLRLDREEAFESDGDFAECSSTSQKSETLAGTPAEPIAIVLSSLFDVFPAPRRLEAMASMCRRWGVDLRGEGASRSLDEKYRSAINKLALKQQRVLERKALREGREDGLLSAIAMSDLFSRSTVSLYNSWKRCDSSFSEYANLSQFDSICHEDHSFLGDSSESSQFDVIAARVPPYLRERFTTIKDFFFE